MSTTITSLSDLKNRRKAKEAAEEQRNKPKANWFKIKNNETLAVRFLGELDENSPNYRPEHGTFLGAVEHQCPGPKGFLSRALDTTETDPEGRDYAVQMYKKTGEADWRKRENFYINVAVDRGGSKPEVEIMSRNLHSDFVDELVEFAEDNENSISDTTFEITRKGSGPQTKWKLKPSKTQELNVDGLEIWKLDEYAVRHIPYEEQAEFYGRNYVPNFKEGDDDEPAPTTHSSPAAAEALDW